MALLKAMVEGVGQTSITQSLEPSIVRSGADSAFHTAVVVRPVYLQQKRHGIGLNDEFVPRAELGSQRLRFVA